MRPVWPIITPGSTGSVAPMTFHPGALRCTMYRMDGLATLQYQVIEASDQHGYERIKVRW